MQPSSMTGSSKILGRHGLELVEGETGREEKKSSKEERKAATGLCRHFCQLAAPYHQQSNPKGSVELFLVLRSQGLSVFGRYSRPVCCEKELGSWVVDA